MYPLRSINNPKSAGIISNPSSKSISTIIKITTAHRASDATPPSRASPAKAPPAAAAAPPPPDDTHHHLRPHGRQRHRHGPSAAGPDRVQPLCQRAPARADRGRAPGGRAAPPGRGHGADLHPHPRAGGAAGACVCGMRWWGKGDRFLVDRSIDVPPRPDNSNTTPNARTHPTTTGARRLDRGGSRGPGLPERQGHGAGPRRGPRVAEAAGAGRAREPPHLRGGGRALPQRRAGADAGRGPQHWGGVGGGGAQGAAGDGGAVGGRARGH